MYLIREADLLPLLPKEGFLAAYLEYAAQITDAPVAYHLLGGLSLLAACAPASVKLQGLPGGDVTANFFAMIVGRPAVDHKTTAVKIATGLLGAASPTRLGDLNGSKEGIDESLAPPFSTKLFAIEEMGDFLASASAGYAEKLKPSLTKLYDCGPIDRRLSKNKRLSVPNPRVSALGAVNTSMLREHARPNDWNGGFLSRWCVFHAHTERDDPSGTYDPELREWLTQWLSWRAEAPCGPCAGLTPEARVMWDLWSANFRNHMRNMPGDALVAAFGRTPLQAAKMALLMAFDTDGTEGTDPWMVDEDAMARALGLAELHWKCIEGLSELAHDSKDARDLQRFLDAVPLGDYVTLGEVMRAVRMTKGRATELMTTLVETGEVRGRNLGGVFKLTRPVPEAEAEVPPEIAPLVTAAQAFFNRGQEPDVEA